MPSQESKKNSQQVRLCESSSTANQPFTSKLASPGVRFSKVIKPLTPSPKATRFDNIIGKVFSKNLIAALTVNDNVQEEVPDSFLTNNDRSKKIQPYIHYYWRELHKQSGCLFTEQKIAILYVLPKALLDDIRACPSGIWGTICMATQYWCPYMIRKLIVRA